VEALGVSQSTVTEITSSKEWWLLGISFYKSTLSVAVQQRGSFQIPRKLDFQQPSLGLSSLSLTNTRCEVYFDRHMEGRYPQKCEITPLYVEV
jgi:hypothetical protein